ncbi:thioredoxin family protein [Pedobacter chitinilyticus]|uniref:Thioredoxin family protein n=1 Tax=Pedobacter chitinilyticus TaxID=2233776 RepID=A0A443YU56_9SPHI|nr:thioredoxin family protein [Pedobacter chitinilyticus]RWU07403.1 thioredoxin family protein [Pedobacter chitinilyticus]
MLDYSNIFDKEALDYPSYRNLVDELLAQGQTTGPDDSEAMLHYTKMNVQRMNRVDKTAVLSEEILETLKGIKGKYHFLVITEGWCGDAAQIVPVINKIVSEAPDQFKLKLTLRDKNLPLIDAHLTNGGRAIPVLLILDEAGNLLLPKWGPRPAVLQGLLAQWKSEGVEMPELAEKLHGWYAKDKTAATQQEINELLKQLL